MQIHTENLTVPNVIWAFVIVMGMLYLVSRIGELLSKIPRAKDLAYLDEDAPPSDEEVVGPQHLPVFKGADHLNPRNCVMVEVSHDVLLSRLARALASEGLAISNTSRSTLRIHPIAGSDIAATRPQNVIGFPAVGS